MHDSAAPGGNVTFVLKQAISLHQRGQLSEAAALYGQILARDPAHADALHLMGVMEAQRKNPSAAIELFDRAIKIVPNNAAFHYNRSLALQELKRLDDALLSYDRVLAIKPDYAEALCNRGLVLQELKRLDDALLSFERALQIKPDFAEALSNRGSVLQIQGRIDEAIACFRRAVAIKPDDAFIHTNLIFALNFDASASATDKQFERAQWDKQHARKFASHIRPHSNDPDPDRRLRIGYVTSHFRRYAATYAFGGVILNHDPKRFEVICYSDTAEEDDVTARLRGRADLWHRTTGMSDDQLAELIRADRIDILVDLVGHMSGRRLLVFARKPAPIQVTAWGEPTGTGLKVMDYLLADSVLVPESERALLSERVINLPNFLGYWMPEPLPEPGPQPALTQGHITFGSFNRLEKITDPTIRAWASILRKLPEAHLILKDRSLTDASQRTRLETAFQTEGVSPARLALLGRSDRASHFAAYRKIDIALDPFPHGGGMTTLDALWMGIPVVAWAGQTISSRLAAASLTALGLTDFIASSPETYVDLAVAKATQVKALSGLRSSLRARIAASEFGDSSRYSRAVETAYREMWQRWCTGHASQARQDEQVKLAFKKGLAFHRQGRLSEAEQLYRSVLLETPAHFDALHMLGLIQRQKGENILALDLIERSIKINPDVATAHHNRGLVLQSLNRLDEALLSYDQVLRIEPENVPALCNRGNILVALKRPENALSSYDRALRIKPDFYEALNNKGTVLLALKRLEEALASYDQVLQLKPDFIEALYNRGSVLLELKRFEDALLSYDKLLKLRPDDAEALHNRGKALAQLQRHTESVNCFAQLVAVSPGHRNALGSLLQARLRVCDWSDYEETAARILANVELGKKADAPFTFLMHSYDPAAQLKCARIYASDKYPAAATRLWKGEVYRHDKIRLAYLSADFHAHATASLMAELFETHDRSEFEVSAISFGPDRPGEMRERVRRPFQKFFDVRTKSDLEVAQILRREEIDIAVDLKGFTEDSRPGILAYRGAPLQVSYLGYPGTMGADYVEYIIADTHVIPPSHDSFYSEKIIRLPDTYQVNDRKRRIDERTPSRADLGLPEKGFVFCCFNNNYKITPAIFDIWMRLLKRVDGSVFWLLEDNIEASGNLKREAERRGVSPNRLVFASRLGNSAHLARHRQADLFLDTLPCNAHTTASDALWAGLPLLTCMGETFASRVAGSLLHAAGLPELIVHDLDCYEALAFNLATSPDTLSDIRRKLERNRSACLLFDTDRFRRHIEAAYKAIYARHQRGDAPESFNVVPIGQTTND